MSGSRPETMWVQLAARFARLFRVIMPDPLLLAVLLSALVFSMAWLLSGTSPIALTRIWNGEQGIWSLLAFTMQMVLILISGHAVAATPLVHGSLKALASVPRNARQATGMVASVAMLAGLLNWGLGLIVGALLARAVGEAAQRPEGRYRVHYPLVCAAGYTGMLTWHGGLSGTAPLMMTTQENVDRFLGAGFDVLPFTRTVLGTENLLLTGGLLLLVPLVLSRMTPLAPGSSDAPPDLEETQSEPEPDAEDNSDALERNVVFGRVAAVLVTAAAGVWWWDRGLARLDPNGLNLTFIALALLLHGSIRNFRVAVQEATSGVSGILLQFPLYAGILGMLKLSGLGTALADLFASTSSPQFHSVLTMLSAACLNIVVPSGGPVGDSRSDCA